jgi:hypothetical protein
VRASVVVAKSKTNKRPKKHKKTIDIRRMVEKKPEHDDFASSIKLMKTF